MKSSTKKIVEAIIREKKTVRAELAQEVSGGFRLRLLDPEVKELSAFMPYSLGVVHGTKLTDVEEILHVHIKEINPRHAHSVVVSGLGQLKAWIYEQEAKAIASLTVGQEVRGQVEDVKPYGVFISLGPVTGLLHSSKIPEEMKGRFCKGDPANVAIDSIDPVSHRIGLRTREKKVSASSMVRRVLGHIVKEHQAPEERVETMEPAKLRDLLQSMAPKDIKATMPKLRKRADWPTRKILGGKYDWWSVVMEVSK